MRLLKTENSEDESWQPQLVNLRNQPHAILSHRWQANPNDEVLFSDIEFLDDGGASRDPSKMAGFLQTVVSQTLIDSLVMRRYPRLTYQQFSSAMASSQSPAPLLGFMYRTAQLCGLWRDICSASSPSLSPPGFRIDNFLSKCRLLDAKMEAMMQGEPNITSIKVKKNAEQNVPAPLWPLFAMSGAPKTLYVYAGIGKTRQWQFYAACRLTLLSTMATALETTLAADVPIASPSTYEQISSEISSSTVYLVKAILATVYFTLSANMPNKPEPVSVADFSGLRGLQLLWPLHAAGTCLICMGQKYPEGLEKLAWIQALFRWIRDELGIQSANFFLQNNLAC